MGCYNRVGFFSNLPIQLGDKMVAFICCGHRRTSDTILINSMETMPMNETDILSPICAPFTCEYDEYGNVRSVDEDANDEFFRKYLHISLSALINLIHDFGPYTFNELSKFEEQIQKRDEKTFKIYAEHGKIWEKQDFQKEEDKSNIEYVKRYMDILSKIFKSIPSLYFTVFDWKDFYICETFERKDVYDSIVEAAKSNCAQSGIPKNDVENGFKFKLKKITKLKKSIEESKINIDTTGSNNIFRSDFCTLVLNRLSEMSKKNKSLLSDKKCVKLTEDIFDIDVMNSPCETLWCGHHFSNVLYDNFDGDWETMESITINYVYFNLGLHLIGGKYALSSYGGQDIPYSFIKDAVDKISYIAKNKI